MTHRSSAALHRCVLTQLERTSNMPMNKKSVSPSVSLRVNKKLARLVADERGASFVEYVIVVGLVAIVCIGAFTTFGTTISGAITTQTGKISTAAGGTAAPAAGK
jgi:pilus assembly protein Flp/PilA